MIENLEENRNKIDRLDDQILNCFLQRLSLAEEIAEYKIEKNMPMEDTQREYEIIERISDISKDKAPFARDFFRGMLTVSRHYQESYSKEYIEDEQRRVVQMPGVYGLLGQRLDHSYSVSIHKDLGLRGRIAYDYRLLEIEPEALENFLARSDIAGLNVTMPYKTAILTFCRELSDDVLRIGAANTVVMKKGRLCAYNTDIAGFKYMVNHSDVKVEGKKCIILGKGGAAKAARCGLEDLGAREIIIVTRERLDNPDLMTIYYDAEIIVNATPVGMYPENLKSLVNLSNFPKVSGVIDVIYNPLRTSLLMQAEELGIPYTGGLSMLVAQARETYNLFFDKEMPDEVVDDITASLIRQNRNIILTGMPGAGKSTIAKKLGTILDREVIDLDKLIEHEQKKSIPNIINKLGEDAFRKLEHDAIIRVCRESGKIIALGGGAILDRNNYPAIHQNGKIFFIRRDVSLLPTDSRPLSKSPETLKEMQKIRLPIYQASADVEIDNNGTIEFAVSRIIDNI